MRLFVANTGDGDWRELTEGTEPAVRVVASDLAQARRARARVKAADGAIRDVILDVTVAIGSDFRSARTALKDADGVHYAGTVAGLTGLIADIEAAGVADGVTLVGASPALGGEVLDRLAARRQPKAS